MPNEKPKKRKTGRIVIGVSIALALIFVISLFITTHLLGDNMMVTETAYHSVAYDTVRSSALVVRDEAYIPASSTNGVLVYAVSDGEKVTAGGTIATAYQNDSDAVTTMKIRELSERISYLESLNSVAQSAGMGLDSVNNQLNEKLIALIGQLNTHSFGSLSKAEDELMTSIYRKQVITGEQGKFDDKIAALKAEKSSLEASCGSPIGSVKATSSGYYVSSVDGYENSVSVESLETLCYSDYEKIEKKDVNPDSYAGKVIRGVNWYVVCPVSQDDAVRISHNSDAVSVRMPYAIAEEIPAKVLYVNTRSGEDQAIVVLQCNYMNEALSKVRSETVEIVLNSYEGLKINKRAIHDGELTRTVTDQNGQKTTETRTVQGVYVEYGSELRFCQIVIAYAGEDYVICDEDPDPALLFNGTTVKLYDKVVTEGSDLYDGKLL